MKLINIGRIEWLHPGKQVEGNDTHGPEVTALVVLTSDDFRCEVERCPLRHQQVVFLAANVREAEINERYLLLVPAEEHVLRLEVAVRDVQRVQIGQRLQRLAHDYGCLLLLEATTRHLFGLRVTALQKLSH